MHLPYTADPRFIGLNSRGIARMLSEETPAVSYNHIQYSIDEQPQTIQPQQIFYDYAAVMAQREARYAPPIPEAPNVIQESSSAAHPTKIDHVVYSDEELNDTDVEDTPSTSGHPCTPAHGHCPSPSSRHKQTRPAPYTTPTRSRYNLSSHLPSPSSPSRPVTRGYAALTRQDVGMARPQLTPGAKLKREVNLNRVHLDTSTDICTYVHPITKEKCRYNIPYKIDWTWQADFHWLTHAAKEYRLMVRQSLGLGQGTIIRTKKLFEEYRKRLHICDACEEGFSKEDLVEKHKHMAHRIGGSRR